MSGKFEKRLILLLKSFVKNPLKKRLKIYAEGKKSEKYLAKNTTTVHLKMYNSLLHWIKHFLVSIESNPLGYFLAFNAI